MFPGLTTFVLSFLFRWSNINVSTLFRFAEPAGGTLVTHRFHRNRLDAFSIIDWFPIFVNRFAFHCRLSAKSIPLLALRILVDLIIPMGCGISCRIIKRSTRAIRMAYFKVPILTMRTIHMRYLMFIAWHKFLKSGPVVGSCCFTLLKSRGFCLLLHSIPIYAAGRLHNRMRCIRFVIIGTVVPKGIAVFTSRFDHAITHRP